MCKNACEYNEPGSQIYKDAKSLKKIVTSKRVEIEQGRYVGPSNAQGKTSERIRNRRLKSGLSHSAITAALQYEDNYDSEEEAGMEEDDQNVDDEEDEELDADEDEESKYGDSENPMWIIYDAVCSFTGTTGKSISDPFKRLPSKRYYPDYYKEIKHPISLAQIKTKIKVSSTIKFGL